MKAFITDCSSRARQFIDFERTVFLQGAGFEYVKGKENYITHRCQEADALWRRKDIPATDVGWMAE
jgi:hypothetical protein